MAADLASTPTTGVQVQCCGDAHLCNFGGFATYRESMAEFSRMKSLELWYTALARNERGASSSGNSGGMTP